MTKPLACFGPGAVGRFSAVGRFNAVLATAAFVLAAQIAFAQVPFNGQWKRNGLAMERFEISGTESRNNPLRRQLGEPFTGAELFVRFRLRYDDQTIDTPADGEGEFFVLWLDDHEGSDTAVHSGVPNIGIHVHGGQNRFMARFSPNGQRFGPKLVGDQNYLIVGRLWKSKPGATEPFDQLDIWVDPRPDEELSPDASASNSKSISEVSWIGFSTGAKTEIDDRIEVWDVGAEKTWNAILGLPPKSNTESIATELAKPTVNFAKHVYPILKSRCFECHQGAEAVEGVRLDVLDEVLNQTVPRHAQTSRLFQLVARGEMPPEGPQLDPEEVAILNRWIDEGLDWDESLLPTPIPQSDHWAFRPIRRPTIPTTENDAWVRTPVDAFIARKRQQHGLGPAPQAPTRVINRRIALDLLGVPIHCDDNTIVDVDALLNDTRYGQRWARYWLDLARWGESNGHQHNRNRPYAWRYRDWVIDAFNSDKPFDDFVRQQIAGDQLTPYRDENLIATGFLASARYSGNELDKEIQRNDILVDIVNTTTKAFLGITLECAQCHTHKFDPLTIRDYYRFQAFFINGQPGNVVFKKHQSSAKSLIDERWRIFDQVHARLVNVKRKQGFPDPILVIPKTVVGKMRPDEKKRFHELEKQIAEFDQSWSFHSPVDQHSLAVAPHEMRWPLPRDPATLQSLQARLLVRGEVKSPGPIVTPGWPVVFGRSPDGRTATRTDLANWMASPDNPLVARVWVNRIWQWHFGRGLVATSGDFGTHGTAPSHSNLLDYLASELIDSGWSTKHIHRLILNSATYRQSSQYSQSCSQVDPNNELLWRWKPRRLEAEAIRDSILVVAGTLELASGGPSARLDSHRRSIYLRQRRNEFPQQMILFDGANGITSCTQRRVSTTPLQPLWLMNSELVQQAAKDFAHRAGSVDNAVRLALGREPTANEVEQLSQLADQHGLKSACFAIINSSEFLYMP